MLLEIDGCDASSLEALVRAICRGKSGSALQLRVQSPGQQEPAREVVLMRGGAASGEAASTQQSGKENGKGNEQENGKGNEQENCSPCVAACQDKRPAASLRELEALQNALREAEDKLAARDAELDAMRARLARQEQERNWAAIDRCGRCSIAIAALRTTLC